MSTLLTLPRLGETMESGRITAWLKKPGDTFERGETILEIETDKTTVEMPALDGGRLTEILAPEGSEVVVGSPLGRYEAVGALPESAVTPDPAALAELTLPRMGETMEEGRLAAWLKQPGEHFRRGEMLAEIETDKVTVEMPALADGQLVETLVDAGSSVAVGAPIARYRPVAGPIAARPAAVAITTPAGPLGAGAPEATPAPAPTPPGRAGPRQRATPLARRLARTAGVDLSGLTGTGRRGRIEKRDVEAASATVAPQGRPPSSLPAIQAVSLPQGRLAYRDWVPETAARRTVLLLHGFGAESGTWAGLAAALARGGVRVVVPDLPGHGTTAIEATGIDAVSEAVAGFASALGLGNADLVGHLMGGAVAARLCASGSLTPRRLTLIAPAGLGDAIDADFILGMAAVRSGGALAHLLRRLARKPPVLSRPQLDAMATAFAAGRLRALADDLAGGGRQTLDIQPDLAALAGPTRVIWGTEDRIIPWTQVAAVPSRIPVHLVAGAGHMPHWDNPTEVAALLG